MVVKILWYIHTIQIGKKNKLIFLPLVTIFHVQNIIIFICILLEALEGINIIIYSYLFFKFVYPVIVYFVLNPVFKIIVSRFVL